MAAWINAVYKPEGRYLDFIRPMYDHFDIVNAVSESVEVQMKETFGIPDHKVMVMKDILDVDFARKMAKLPLHLLEMEIVAMLLSLMRKKKLSSLAIPKK